MYPTGGYGNFLYSLLSEHLESTVKISFDNPQFNAKGNSHRYPKYTEVFSLGQSYVQKNLKDFKYNYQILDTVAQEQIRLGKYFVVLADVGNKGDNLRFLRRFFPNAIVIRLFANTFEEKLILWTNAMTKLTVDLYPGSIMPRSGIAAWAKKPIDELTDFDAVSCMINFFDSDFDPYGKFFCHPDPGAINFSIGDFFVKAQLKKSLANLAQSLGTVLIKTEKLDQLLDDFYMHQMQLSLLDDTKTSFLLTRQALNEYKNKN